MMKMIRLVLCLLTACALTACTATADERTGSAQGYGGEVKVSITMDGSRITGVTVLEHNETPGVGTRAIDELPARIAQKGDTQVDVVAGATITSQAIMAAVNQAAGISAPSASPAASPEATGQPAQAEALANLRTGTGMTASGRVGPGKDDKEQQVYSFNVVFASAAFDGEGRIALLKVDQLEVCSPNIGEGAAVFSGFPAKEEDADAFLAEVSAWRTKGQRGEEYKLTSGTWRQEMDAYEKLFTGMTVAEVEQWVETYCSAVTGRPLKAVATDEGDLNKYNALSEEDKARLADVTATATMSLNDVHGDILGAIRGAWEAAQK